MALHAEKQYPQVISCLQNAILYGQSQPWMYEVLALTMEIESYPKEAVERVVLSLTDFGDANFESMMYSGAYLTRFGRKAAALGMYRQASRMLPERPEPYVLGLKLAKDTGDSRDIAWAGSGILLNYWKPDYMAQHKAAELELRDQLQKARRANDEKLAEELNTLLTDARSRDLSIRLEWNGSADLDMQIEEPSGSVCSFENPETQGGGLYLHDGVGPQAANAYELYLCPRAVAGPYRIRITNQDGKLVGNRATLTVTIREGLPDQSRFTRTLTIEGEEVSLTVDLPKGRRTQPRMITGLFVPGVAERAIRPVSASIPVSPEERARRAESQRQFLESRQGPLQLPRAGAFGYAPQIQTISEGSGMTGQAVISADRRYVRIGIQPVFNEVTDIFTFTFVNGGNPGN